MGNVNFYLKAPVLSKDPKNKKLKRSLIYLKYKYNGTHVLVYSFGQTIDPANWNSSKQRVKSNTQTTADGQYLLNDLLDNLEKVCKTAYNLEIKNGVPTPSMLKVHLNKFLNQNSENKDAPTFFKLLDRFISGEIKHKGKEKSPNTIKTYNTLLGHLKAFEAVKGTHIDYGSIDLDFLYKYITFLRSSHSNTKSKIQDEKILKSLKSLPIGQNAIAKDVQILKTILKKAVTLGESKNIWHEHGDFVAGREDTDAVYLNEKEITRLYRFDLSHSKRLEAIRDLFVFSCYVGLRYSDASTVKPENIITVENEENSEQEYFIRMITQKTKDLVIIPCSPVVLEIFEKYKHNPNRLPQAVANQTFNEGIKEVLHHAGFHETGRLLDDPSKELWKCVSSHTARRSFATNLYLEGFPVIDLMKITGHRTERAFMRYIRVTKLDAAKRLNTHIKKMWNNKLLRVAG